MHILLLVLFALSVLLQLPASAQTTSADARNASLKTPLKVLAIGGFLGQMDGFCEQPGGSYDVELISKPEFVACAGSEGTLSVTKPKDGPVTMGGLLGGRKWVDNDREGALVLITGNNQVANFTFLNERVLDDAAVSLTGERSAPDPTAERVLQTQQRLRRFWQEMDAANADAIGLGPEDFVRSLRDPRDSLIANANVKNRGSILHRWLRRITREGSGMPLIGSNAIVKWKSNGFLSHLNVIDKGGFSLAGLAKDEPSPWLAEIKIGHKDRATLKDLSFTVTEVGPVKGIPKRVPVKVTKTEVDSTHTTLAIDDGTLLPGYGYEVQARFDQEDIVLTFQTYSALTPRKNNLNVLNGFPVVATSEIDGAPLVIISLVDPSIKSLLGSDAWSWKPEPCANDACEWEGVTCPEDECEIDFLPPVDAVRAAIQRSYRANAKRKPLLVLISALSDENTQAVLEAFPEIRIVVLPQESSLLGRGSREFPVADPKDKLLERLADRGNKRHFSGDLGMAAVINPWQPASTHLLVRPEWIGETGARLYADLQYAPDDSEWLLDNEVVDVKVVPGAALVWAPAACPPNATAGAECTAFAAVLPDSTYRYGSFESYRVCELKAPSGYCDRFSKLATNAEAFKVFAGDAFRLETGAEMAIVPGGLVDPDAQAWLARVVDKDHTRVLTRFILERAIYRSYRIVRASVVGDQLVATLDKALKANSHDGSCVVGIGNACAGSVDIKGADQFFVNGRLIDTRMYYSIAMPEGLAAELDLDHSEGKGHTGDAVSLLHSRLIQNRWDVPGKDSEELSTRIIKRGNRKLQHNQIGSAIQVGFSELTFVEPLGSPIGKTDIDFQSATPARSLLTKGNVDIALIDLPNWALRAVTDVDFKRSEVLETDQVTIDKNQFTAGGRFDVKVPMFKREVRVYGGYFIEGEIRRSVRYLDAKIAEERPEGLLTRKADAPTRFRRPPSRFQYYAAGVDFLNIWKPFSESWLPIDITKGAIQYAYGTRRNIPIGSAIDGVVQSQALFMDKGAQGVLDGFYSQHPTSFSPAVDFIALVESRQQQRLQFEFNFEPSVKIGSKTLKFGTELRLRIFPDVADSDQNSARKTRRMKFSFTIPLYERLQLEPSYERQSATTDLGRYRYSSFEVNFKVPFVVRGGVLWPGWLFR